MNALAPSSASVELTDKEFEAFVAIAARSAGLAIPDSKKSLVQSRVARRLRTLKIATAKEYLDFVSQDKSEERELISVLTTNVSSFYRENHHFDFLRDTIAPRLREKLNSGQPVRIWSAGCSSGQEPYTIATELTKALPGIADKDFLILASDIDPAILKKAKAGEYPSRELDAFQNEDRSRLFTPVEGAEDLFRVSDELKSLIRFRELNLHGPWPMQSKFDAIFCRNVLIYFNDDHQNKLWPRFRNQLEDGGWLLIGHSERIQNTESHGFKTVGVTTYQKT